MKMIKNSKQKTIVCIQKIKMKKQAEKLNFKSKYTRFVIIIKKK